MGTKKLTEMQAAFARQSRLLALYKKASVLVIEDGPEARSILRGIMRDAGVVNLDLAVSGQEAIELLRSRPYDIILCDYNLGKGKDGQQVLEEARFSKYISYSAIFIMITAETTVEMVMGALEYQPDSYLSKPYSKNDLMARLNRAVESKIEYRDIEASFNREQFTKTIVLCDEKIASSPELPMRACRIKGECLVNQEHYDDARSLFQKILDEREVPWAKIGLGKTLFFLKEYDLSSRLFRELTQEQPNVVESYDWLARIQLAQNNVRDAQVTLIEATSRSPKAVLRQMELARVALVNHSYLIAEKAFRKSIVLASNSCYHSPDNYLYYVRTLLIKIDQSKSTTSREAFQEALLFLSRLRREFEKDTTVKFRAGMLESLVYHSYGRQKESVASMEKAEDFYWSFEEEKRVVLAEEYVTSLTLVDRIAEGEQLAEKMQRNGYAPELIQKLLNRIQEGKRRMFGEKLNLEAMALYERGQIGDAYSKFSEAASTRGASAAVLLNATKICIELAERQDLNKDEWRKECGAYLERLTVLDRFDHRYERFLSYKNRFERL